MFADAIRVPRAQMIANSFERVLNMMQSVYHVRRGFFTTNVANQASSDDAIRVSRAN